MRELETVRDAVLQLFDKDSWIQFVHEGLLPEYTNEEKNLRNMFLTLNMKTMVK